MIAPSSPSSAGPRETPSLTGGHGGLRKVRVAETVKGGTEE